MLIIEYIIMCILIKLRESEVHLTDKNTITLQIFNLLDDYTLASVQRFYIRADWNMHAISYQFYHVFFKWAFAVLLV